MYQYYTGSVHCDETHVFTYVHHALHKKKFWFGWYLLSCDNTQTQCLTSKDMTTYVCLALFSNRFMLDVKRSWQSAKHHKTTIQLSIWHVSCSRKSLCWPLATFPPHPNHSGCFSYIVCICQKLSQSGGILEIRNKWPHTIWEALPQRGRERQKHVNYSRIACQLEVGTSLGRRHNQVQFQIRDHFLIPRPRLHGAIILIFCKA